MADVYLKTVWKNCQVWSLDYNGFKDKYGYTACQVGGSYEYSSPEDVEYYKEHEEEFKSIYRDHMKNRFEFCKEKECTILKK